VLPLGTTDAGLDEGDNGLDNSVTEVLSKELETRGGGHGLGPVVLVSVLLLLREKLEQDREDLVEGELGKVLGLDGGLLTVRDGLGWLE
jgi:hypothetical protein